MTDMTIARTIISQIKTLDHMALFAWGFKNAFGLEDGVQFDVNGLKFKGKVIIKLNGSDLYDITFGRMNRKTFEFDVKETAEDIYCDQLVEILDHYIEGK